MAEAKIIAGLLFVLEQPDKPAVRNILELQTNLKANARLQKEISAVLNPVR